MSIQDAPVTTPTATPVPPDSLAPTTSDPHLEAAVLPKPADERVSERKLATDDKRGSDKSKAATADDKRGSDKSKAATADDKRSSSKIALDDEHEHFFAGADEAVASMHAEARRAAIHEEVQARPVERLTPEQIARRYRYRRAVSVVVGVAASLAAVMLLRLSTTPKQSELARLELPPMPKVAAPTTAIPSATVDLPLAIHHDDPPAPSADDPTADDVPATSASAAASAAPDASAATSAAASASAASAAASASAPAVSASAPAASASATAALSASAPAAAASAPVDAAQAKELTKQALRALESGSFKAAIDKASASVDADPTDANAYMYWGTALMEQGKMKEAKAIFARCVESATRGPKHECRTFKLRGRRATT